MKKQKPIQLTIPEVDKASPPRPELVRHTQYVRKADLEKAAKVAKAAETSLSQVVRDAMRAGLAGRCSK